MLRPEEIKVGLGKYYVDWSRQEPYAVKADVRLIHFTSIYLKVTFVLFKVSKKEIHIIY